MVLFPVSLAPRTDLISHAGFGAQPQNRQLGSADKAISRMRHILLTAAKALAEGTEPPAVAAGLDYAAIRGAEKILQPGEDWRLLGTGSDPVVQEALGLDPPPETGASTP